MVKLKASIFAEVKPFVKWAGGKRRVIPQIQHLIPEFKNYCEPFVGGGSLLFYMFNQFRFNDSLVYLSDTNEELINAYRVFQKIENMDGLYGLLYALTESDKMMKKEMFYSIRNLDRDPNFKTLFSDLQRAARFLYMNKAGFNGLHRVNSSGQNNVSFGDGKDIIFDFDNFDRIFQMFSVKHSKFTFGCHGFDKIPESVAGSDWFVYFDPPYIPVSKTANFTSYSGAFGIEEHKKLFDKFVELHESGCKVMISGSDTEWMREKYKDFNIHEVFVGRQINSDPEKRGKVKEIVVTNYK